jgi:hypothetical protein
MTVTNDSMGRGSAERPPVAFGRSRVSDVANDLPGSDRCSRLRMSAATPSQRQSRPLGATSDVSMPVPNLLASVDRQLLPHGDLTE